MAVGFPARRLAREPSNKHNRKPMSIMTIALIAILVVAVIIVGLLSALFFLGAWKPFGEVVGSGNLVTNEEFFSDFSSVDAASGFKLEISQSNSYSILIEADDNALEYIDVRKSGDTLVIGVELGYNFKLVTLNAEITMPELHSLELSGGAKVILEGFNATNQFSVNLSGGSTLRGEFATSKDVNLDLSGGSVLTELVGEANDLIIDASSGSVLDLSNFAVHDASVELSGGSISTINLDGRLDADLSGGSQLWYIGDPILGNIETSSGSNIHKSSLPD